MKYDNFLKVKISIIVFFSIFISVISIAQDTNSTESSLEITNLNNSDNELSSENNNDEYSNYNATINIILLVASCALVAATLVTTFVGIFIGLRFRDINKELSDINKKWDQKYEEIGRKADNIKIVDNKIKDKYNEFMKFMNDIEKLRERLVSSCEEIIFPIRDMRAQIPDLPLGPILPDKSYKRKELREQLSIYENKLDKYITMLPILQSLGYDLQAIDYFYKGIYYYLKGEFENSISEFNISVQKNHNVAKSLYNIGVCYATLDKKEEALEYFIKATSADNTFAEAWLNAGILYAESVSVNKDRVVMEKAFECFEKAITLKYNFAEAYYNRGVLQNNLEQYDDAENSYLTATKIRNDFSEAWYSIGILYVQKAKINLDDDILEKSLTYFDKTLEINKMFLEAWYNRGLVYINLADHKKDISYFIKAINSFDRVLEIKNDIAEAWYIRGGAYSNILDKNKALKDLAYSIFLNPEYKKRPDITLLYKTLTNDPDFKNIIK